MAVMGIAIVLGLLAERVLDTGIRIPGIGVAAGLLGFYLGAWLWDLTGWSMGPLPAALPLVPTAAGAFAVCGSLKLIRVAAERPYRPSRATVAPSAAERAHRRP